MDSLVELANFYEKIVQYDNLISKWINTPFPSSEIANEIQNLRTELQRDYSRLEDVIARYGGYRPKIDPIFGQKWNVFDIAFGPVDFSNYTGKFNALNDIKEIVNKAIGKLGAEKDATTPVVDWTDKNVIRRLERVFKPFEGKRETPKKESIEHDNEKTQKSAILFELREKYLRMRSSARPQNRGYELEKLLYKLFRLFELSPSKSFKITGEQIDGSFTLEGVDFLIEAQWEKGKPTAEDLYGFQGKVARKYQGTRGLFISIEGFSPTSRQAFERGMAPNILLFDGEDLVFVLEERIDLNTLIAEKRKHASRTGEVYCKARTILGEPI